MPSLLLTDTFSNLNMTLQSSQGYPFVRFYGFVQIIRVYISSLGFSTFLYFYLEYFEGCLNATWVNCIVILITVLLWMICITLLGLEVYWANWE